MRILAIVALAAALAGCGANDDPSWSWGSSRSWRAVNAEDVPVAEARAACNEDAQRTTAAIANLAQRVSEQRRISDDCLTRRGY